MACTTSLVSTLGSYREPGQTSRSETDSVIGACNRRLSRLTTYSTFYRLQRSLRHIFCTGPLVLHRLERSEAGSTSSLGSGEASVSDANLVPVAVHPRFRELLSPRVGLDGEGETSSQVAKPEGMP